MDTYDPNCDLEMDCEEENDDEEVFRTFLCTGNRGVEVTDQGDMYITKSNTDLLDVEDTCVAEEIEDPELQDTEESPEEDNSEEDIIEEDIESSDEGDDKNDTDWTGSDAASLSDGSSSSNEDYDDEEIRRELQVLTGKVTVNKKKNVSSKTTFSAVSKKRNERSTTGVQVTDGNDDNSTKTTIFRIGLDKQVLSKTIVLDKKYLQMARQTLESSDKLVKIPNMVLKKTNVQQGKQESVLTKMPGKIIRIIKVVRPKSATNIGQVLNAKGDCSQKKSNNTEPVLGKEKTTEMPPDFIHAGKKEVIGMLASSAASEKDLINSTKMTQTVCKLSNSSVISKAVEKGDKSSNETVLSGTDWKGDFTSSVGAKSIGQDNFNSLVTQQGPTNDYEPCNVTIKQEPNSDFEPCNNTPILQDSMEVVEPRYSYATIKQEPKDDLEFDGNVAVQQEPEYSKESCGYQAVSHDHNYACSSEVGVHVPSIKQEPQDDVHGLMSTSTAGTQTIMESELSCDRHMELNREAEQSSSSSVPSKPTHLHLKRKQSEETNIRKNMSKSIKLDHSTPSQSTVKPLSSQSSLSKLSQSSLSKLIVKLPSSPSIVKTSSNNAVKSTLSKFVAKSSSSQSTVQSTVSRCTLPSTSSQSTVNCTPFLFNVKLVSSNSIAKLTPLHPIPKTAVPSQTTVKLTSSMSRKVTGDKVGIKNSREHENKFQKDELNIPCPFCKLCFASRAEMADHCMVHYVQKSRKYKCSICKEIFSEHRDLKMHKATVHGLEKTSHKIRQSTCSKCKSQSTQSQSAKQSTPSQSIVNQTSAMSNTITGDNVDSKNLNENELHKDNVPCPVCKLCFPSKEEMTNHCALHYAHKSVNRKYQCDICKDMFTKDVVASVHRSEKT